jgi:acid phosphatase
MPSKCKLTFQAKVFLGFIFCLLQAQSLVLAKSPSSIHEINQIVIIYAENRSFDHLYGLFPGANGIFKDANGREKNLSEYLQKDRDGLTTLSNLPQVWNAAGRASEKSLSFVSKLPNQPFQLDASPGSLPVTFDLSDKTPDLVHRFYNNQMQINDGKNDQFSAWSDAGGLAMGYYNGESLKMWQIAREYTLADNFFMGSFGGSFLNHFWLVCACTPIWQDAPKSIRILEKDNKLITSPTSPKSAKDGPPIYLGDNSVTTDGFVVNTLQPPFQPSGVPSNENGDHRLAAASASVLPPQTQRTIGDALNEKSVSWTWYAGGYNEATADRSKVYKKDGINYQAHHQPFNYFSHFDPTTKEGQNNRTEHLKDLKDFEKAIHSGNLPSVSFYKPQGNLNQHPGYGDILSGDEHIAHITHELMKSPQWKHMLIIVTYDENGGFWDHVAPPKIDRWGPGSRIPTIIISPFAKKGFVDHTLYDTTSILKLITKRFDLEPLTGVRKEVGSFENSLNFENASN